MRSYLHTALNALGYLLLAALVALFLLFALTAVPQTGLDSRVVYSGSMQPDIPTGAVVFTAKKSTYEVGDVVTFQRGSDTPTTHRIVGEEAGEFRTKGDANKDPDIRPVEKGQVLGSVFFHLPYLGYLLAG